MEIFHITYGKFPFVEGTTNCCLWHQIIRGLVITKNVIKILLNKAYDM